MTDAARFGVRTPRAFLTNVLVVLVGKANALAMMQLVHHGLRDVGATPLSVDDSDPRAAAYFFDVAPPHLGVAGLPVRASVFGVKGMANPHLPALLAAAHALVVASDGADDPAVAAQTLAARMVSSRRGEVYAVRVEDSEGARDALLAVLEDLVEKAGEDA